MKLTKQLVLKLILEAVEKEKAKKKEKASPKKSSNKLLDIKNNLSALKQMREELKLAKFAEVTATTEVEYADLVKFANELNLIKAKGVALEQKLDNQIQMLEDKLKTEKDKIKSLIGLTSDNTESDE